MFFPLLPSGCLVSIFPSVAIRSSCQIFLAVSWDAYEHHLAKDAPATLTNALAPAPVQPWPMTFSCPINAMVTSSQQKKTSLFENHKLTHHEIGGKYGIHVDSSKLAATHKSVSPVCCPDVDSHSRVQPGRRRVR